MDLIPLKNHFFSSSSILFQSSYAKIALFTTTIHTWWDYTLQRHWFCSFLFNIFFTLRLSSHGISTEKLKLNKKSFENRLHPWKKSVGIIKGRLKSIERIKSPCYERGMLCMYVYEGLLVCSCCNMRRNPTKLSTEEKTTKKIKISVMQNCRANSFCNFILSKYRWWYVLDNLVKMFEWIMGKIKIYKKFQHLGV